MKNTNKKAIVYIALSILVAQNLVGAIHNSYAETSVEEIPSVVHVVVSDEAQILRISDEATLVKKDTSSGSNNQTEESTPEEEQIVVEVVEEEAEQEVVTPTTQVAVESEVVKAELALPTPGHLQNIVISKKAELLSKSSSSRDLLKIFVRNKNKFGDVHNKAYSSQDFITAWKVLSHNYGQKETEILQIEKQRFIEIYLTLK